MLTGLLTSVQPNPRFCTPPECTGSLYRPAKTEDINIQHTLEMVGLVMVGFAGHAVFPTLRNDMQDKAQYAKMVRQAYLVPHHI